MKNIYEQIIESLINDDEATARELFHQEVVRQSRNIYNQIVAEEAKEEEEEEEEEMEESMSMDQTDDMMGDVKADQEGMDHDGFDDMDHDDMDMDHDDLDHDAEHGDMEDRVVDLEDALDELKAEFDRLMSDEEHEPEHHDGVDDPSFGDEEDEMEDEGIMREYVEKVGEPYKMGNSEGQPVGSTNTSPSSTNAKSIVAGKNDMGGTAKNLNQGGAEAAPEGKAYSSPSNQYSKGKGNLKGAGSYENVPGANAGKAFSNAKKPITTDGAANDKSIVAKR